VIGMPVWHLLLLGSLLQVPAAEIETLKGDRHAGELVELNETSAILKEGSAKLTLPLAGVLEIRFPGAPAAEASTGARIVLADGSRLTLSGFSVAGEKARCDSQLGPLTLPVSRIANVRFGISTAKLDESWGSMLARESKNDLLVVKKEDVLDFLAGVTGDVGEKIAFLLDGDEVPVPREKAYGIIFHRRVPNLPKGTCQVKLTGGDVLEAVRCVWDGKDCKVRLIAGPDVVIPASQLAAVDFTPYRIKYLSDLKPRDVEYVPFYDIFLYEYRRDRSLDGPPLKLGGKTYARGLAMHSKTTLRYRIGSEYTRFQAVAGIDDSVSSLARRDDTRYASVRLVISGDGKPLFDAIVKGTDAPRALDLDVTNVRDLEILVDFNEFDEADHLDLADAKLLK
jgi:NPCBM/NEW2 domain